MMINASCSRRKAFALPVTITALVLGLLLSNGKPVGKAFAESFNEVPDVPPVPKIIAGKPYSVTPGETPGTWTVKWGDQSMVWKAQPWMEERQQKLGPAFNAQWATPGLPYPYEIPIEKRDKIPANEWPDRSLTFSNYAPYYTNGWDVSPVVIHLPDGSIRTTAVVFEFYSTFTSGNGREYLSSAEISAGNVARKYLWELTAPEELRGEGGVTTVFTDPNLIPEDLLYLPTVRRTRRLAGAVAKQYYPSTIFRYEEVTYTGMLPQLDYEITGYKLFDPSDKLRAYSSAGYPANSRRVSGAGDVVAILEVTPKPGVSWWYAKRIEYIGLMGMCMYYSEQFDASGKKMRYMTHLPMTGANPVVHMGSPSGPSNAPGWWILWGAYSCVELDSGFLSDGWIETGGFNAKTSASIFSPTTLAAQPLTLVDWLAH